MAQVSLPAEELRYQLEITKPIVRHPLKPSSAQMRPKPTSSTRVAYLVGLVHGVATGTHPLALAVPLLLWLADAVLCVVVIRKVPYTEIDWSTYIEQIELVLSGQRDYKLIEGATGPLVYPAAHVYLYMALYHLTDRGKNILLAQGLFTVLYLATLALVMTCYWKAKVPPYIFPLLVMSKRLHSIFMLRCFNDGFAAFFFWLALYLFQARKLLLGIVIYSWGLGVKMTLLLGLPGVGTVLFLGRGLPDTIRLVMVMVQVQVLIGMHFLLVSPVGYSSRSFDLTRRFMFEWTVNWRMLSESVFSSRLFSMTLLAGHATVLFSFLTRRWLRPAARPVSALLFAILNFQSPFTRDEARIIAVRATTTRYVLTTVLTANLIGLLFARSLHYQFYAYLGWATPYLLWSSARSRPVLVFILCGLQEWAWNVFPSTPLSSTIVVAVLATTVGLVWLSGRDQNYHDEAVATVKRDE